ncbi:hypothetical protein BH09ACT8_BH09ACT8_09900 [soil metagenome]
MLTIMEMLGVPAADQPAVAKAAEKLFSMSDDEYSSLEERAWQLTDFENRIGPAVEEFVRWASPVMQFARFAVADTEISGQPIKAGDKVGLFYCSANRDEEVFTAPGEFDVQRASSPHLGFGGGGPHFCLGSQLAKAELRNLFRELLTRLERVEFGEPELLHSNFVHGIKRVPACVR